MTDKPINHRKADELEAKIISHLRLSINYAEMAIGSADIYDRALFQIIIDKWLNHARDVSKSLTELRKERGILD